MGTAPRKPRKADGRRAGNLAAVRAGMTLAGTASRCGVRRGRPLGIGRRWMDIDWTMRNIDIAQQMGLSRERIRKVRKRLGLPPLPPQHRRAIREWLQLHAEAVPHLTVGQICALLRRTSETVRREMAELGMSCAPFAQKKELLPKVLSGLTHHDARGCWEWPMQFHFGSPRWGSVDVRQEIYRWRRGAAAARGSGILCMHGNRRCVNPDHLREIPVGQVRYDSPQPISAARDTRCPRRLLSPEDIADIRRDVLSGEATILGLCQEWECSPEFVVAIVQGMAVR